MDREDSLTDAVDLLERAAATSSEVVAMLESYEGRLDDMRKKQLDRDPCESPSFAECLNSDSIQVMFPEECTIAQSHASVDGVVSGTTVAVVPEDLCRTNFRKGIQWLNASPVTKNKERSPASARTEWFDASLVSKNKESPASERTESTRFEPAALPTMPRTCDLRTPVTFSPSPARSSTMPSSLDSPAMPPRVPATVLRTYSKDIWRHPEGYERAYTSCRKESLADTIRNEIPTASFLPSPTVPCRSHTRVTTSVPSSPIVRCRSQSEVPPSPAVASRSHSSVPLSPEVSRSSHSRATPLRGPARSISRGRQRVPVSRASVATQPLRSLPSAPAAGQRMVPRRSVSTPRRCSARSTTSHPVNQLSSTSLVPQTLSTASPKVSESATCTVVSAIATPRSTTSWITNQRSPTSLAPAQTSSPESATYAVTVIAPESCGMTSTMSCLINQRSPTPQTPAQTFSSNLTASISGTSALGSTVSIPQSCGTASTSCLINQASPTPLTPTQTFSTTNLTASISGTSAVGSTVTIPKSCGTPTTSCLINLPSPTPLPPPQIVSTTHLTAPISGTSAVGGTVTIPQTCGTPTTSCLTNLASPTSLLPPQSVSTTNLTTPISATSAVGGTVTIPQTCGTASTTSGLISQASPPPLAPAQTLSRSNLKSPPSPAYGVRNIASTNTSVGVDYIGRPSICTTSMSLPTCPQLLTPKLERRTTLVDMSPQVHRLSKKIDSILEQCKHQLSASRKGAIAAEAKLIEEEALTRQARQQYKINKLAKKGIRHQAMLSSDCTEVNDLQCHRQQRRSRADIKEPICHITESQAEPGMVDLCFDLVD